MDRPYAAASRVIAIIGAGTYGTVLQELAESCGYRVLCYLDDSPDKWGRHLDGVIVQGPVDAALDDLPVDCSTAVAIGDNGIRLRWLLESRRRGREIPSLVSPHAIVSDSAIIQDGVYLHPGCHVWTHARLGLGTILSPHATVAHHTSMGSACFVSTGANVGASIQVDDEAMFGIGSTTSTGVKRIGRGTLVGAGAVVIRDTQPYGVYVGSPGRLLRLNRG